MGDSPDMRGKGIGKHGHFHFRSVQCRVREVASASGKTSGK
jgi:hypothetical protein